MIYRHKHLKAIFLDQKQVVQITRQKPLVFILEEGQFLSFTIKTCMSKLGIPHIISPIQSKDLQEQRKNMGHEVPTLIFANQVLQTDQLIEFICDAAIDDQQFIDFQTRKALIKGLATTWKQIFIFQRLWPYNFQKLRKLGVRNKKDYRNLIMQGLQNISSYFMGRNIQKAFSSYREESIQIQNIIFVDIIQTIIRKTPESYVDFILRRNFPNLINLSEKFQKYLDQAIAMNWQKRFEVVIEYPEPKNESKSENLRLNHKRFLFVFGFMATMYGIFAKS